MAGHIFISYSKKDSRFAHKLADDLTASGFRIWIDRSIGGGEDWREDIEKNLKAAGDVIVVVSQNSMASGWVLHEGSMARAWDKRLIPVRIENVGTLPPWAEEIQWIDFVDKPHEVAYNTLVEALTPPNPIQELLDRKHYNFETYQLLLEPRELEIVSAQLSDPDTQLTDADRRLLLYSAVAHGLDQNWMEVVGENRKLWLREALQDRECPMVVREGAAAILGAESDRAAYEQLIGTIKELNPESYKEEPIDLLAIFLHHSPKKFELPRKIRWDVFLRLARMRIKDGAMQRIRIRKTASFFALLCVGILMLSIYIQFEFFASTNNDWGNYVVGVLFFAIPGFVTAYGFAEVMTSLMLIITRWRLVWQIFVLTITGSVIGIALFFLLAGDHGVWFAGGIIGLTLALFNHKPGLKNGWYPGLLSLMVGLLMFALSLPVLTGVKEGKSVELLGSAISTGLFTSVYIFISSQTE